MVRLSNIQHPTSVHNLFSSGHYHTLWKECDKRMQEQKRFSVLNDTQRHIAADVALRTIATERAYGLHYPDRDGHSMPTLLYTSLYTVGNREKIFDKDHSYMKDFLSKDKEDSYPEYLALLEIAGLVVYDWEKIHGRFPHRMESGHEDFYLETSTNGECELYYDRGVDLPMSPFIKAEKSHSQAI